MNRSIGIILLLSALSSLSVSLGQPVYRNDRLGIQFEYNPDDEVDNPMAFCDSINADTGTKAFSSDFLGISFRYPDRLALVVRPLDRPALTADSSIALGFFVETGAEQTSFVRRVELYSTREPFDKVANAEGFHLRTRFNDTTKQWLTEGGRGPSEPAVFMNGKQWKGLRGPGEMGLFSDDGYAGLASTLTSFLVYYQLDSTAIVCSFWNGPESEHISENPSGSSTLCESQFYDIVSSIKFGHKINHSRSK